MSDRPSATELNADAVARALRGLPAAAPPGGGWETLAASLRAQGLVRAEDMAQAATPASGGATVQTLPRRPRAPRRWIPYALAAGLGLFALTLLPLNHDPGTPPELASNSGTTPPATTVAATVDLPALRAESSRIEEWLRTLKADETPLDGRSLMAATEIEDMIGLVDLQLAAGSDAGSDAAALWRERVELLRDLAAVRTTYSLAGTGIAANGTAAAPDNWTTL
jgi:hypothetical protein